jgi:putative hemolysin
MKSKQFLVLGLGRFGASLAKTLCDLGQEVLAVDADEELVGNIYDEFDPQAEQEIIQLEENLWRVSGSADLEELAEAMDFQLPEDEDRDYDTLGGLVFAQLAVIPEDGSRPVVEALGLRIRVEELCDRRVEWALVEKQAPAAAACE